MSALRRATIAEEGLVDLRAVDSKWTVFGTVCSKAAAVLVDEFVVGSLIVVPNSTVSCFPIVHPVPLDVPLPIL